MNPDTLWTLNLRLLAPSQVYSVTKLMWKYAYGAEKKLQQDINHKKAWIRLRGWIKKIIEMGDIAKEMGGEAWEGYSKACEESKEFA